MTNSAGARKSSPAAVQVPLLDLKAQYKQLAAEITIALQQICESQQFILGRHVIEFESAAAHYCGCREAVGVSSGTDALLLALMALGIGPGDEVITSTYSFFATAGVVARVGARPIFCDIEPESFNIDVEAVAAFVRDSCLRREGELINRRTGGRVRALMPVHLYGQCVRMPALLELAREFRLKLIEDAAQAIGATGPDGVRAGAVGDVGCLSFFPSKNLGAFGDAGMCLSQDHELGERMRILRVHGANPKYHHTLIGGNFRLDEIQAAVLHIKLRHLEDWTKARQRNAALYGVEFERAGLTERIVLPRTLPGMHHTWNQYVIRAPERNALKEFLTQHGVGSEIYYPIPLHLQQCFAALGHRPGDFPQAERAAAESLALPIFPELQPQQLHTVVEQIAAFYS
jgi:dTDP-4-amino-4,6-dideoxygalactose transaminase